jgi:genome maintenance exonuclease 1
VFTHSKQITPLELKVIEGPKGRFYVTPEGNKYPSITTVLGAKDKPWLAEWRSSLGEQRADKETKRTAARGDAVHLMVERFLNNDPEPTRDQKDEHISEFNTIKLFLKKIDNIMLQESALYSDVLRVAGRVDCIASYGGKLSIIDFKTSTNTKYEDMVQDYFLQTAAYAVMFHERFDIQIDQLVIIMTIEKGAVPLVFRRQVEDYLQPLCERINTFHTTRGAK